MGLCSDTAQKDDRFYLLAGGEISYIVDSEMERWSETKFAATP